MAMTSSIPMDIIYSILVLLPVKSLLRFKCVCRSWYALINSPDFVESHSKHSLETNSNSSLIFTPPFCYSKSRQEDFYLYHTHSFNGFSHGTRLNLPPFFGKTCQVIGSCNGLICLDNYGMNLLALCNPSTRLFRLVPTTNPLTSSGGRSYVVPLNNGFGYDHRGDDYKIVQISSKKCMVYSLRTDSWTIFGYHGKLGRDHDNGVLVNNRLHWWSSECEISQTFSFDLHDHKWRKLPLPKSGTIHIINALWITLGVLDGSRLCATFSCHHEGYSYIWMMKEYGVKESWAKVYSFPYIDLIPIRIYNEECDEVLLTKNYKRYLFLWNSQMKRLKEIAGPPIDYSGVQTCIDSLAPLMGDCYVLKEMKTKRKGP